MALAKYAKGLLYSVNRRGCLNARMYSYLQITKDEQKEMAVLALNRKPVNSMNLEMLKEISGAIEELEAEKKVRGVIITSNFPRIFSSGLDLTEICKPEPARMSEFWTAFQEMWLKVYGTSLATVAAINGNSPAGGCILANCCDYRIMAEGKYRIGLSETQLGMAPSLWATNNLINIIGRHEAELAVGLGRLFTTTEALELGLVDKLVPEDQVLTVAQEEIKRWLKMPERARKLQKQLIRKSTIDAMMDTRQQDLEHLNSQALHEKTQQILDDYMENLKKNKSKK